APHEFSLDINYQGVNGGGWARLGASCLVKNAGYDADNDGEELRGCCLLGAPQAAWSDGLGGSDGRAGPAEETWAPVVRASHRPARLGGRQRLPGAERRPIHPLALQRGGPGHE